MTNIAWIDNEAGVMRVATCFNADDAQALLDALLAGPRVSLAWIIGMADVVEPAPEQRP
jgi:hypothetical protein